MTQPQPVPKAAPKHRAERARPVLAVPRRAVRTSVVLSLAVGATGTAVAGGVVGSSATGVAGTGLETASVTGEGALSAVTGTASPGADAAEQAGRDETSGAAAGDRGGADGGTGTGADDSSQARAADLGRRTAEVSRSDRRQPADPVKVTALAAGEASAISGSEDIADSDPRDIARALMPQFGFSADQFGCLDSLWTKESGWDVYADNPTSSAYGIPQALPGEKMSAAGADWADNPETQIRWGLGYIDDVYGSPCSAWGHSQAVNWY